MKSSSWDKGAGGKRGHLSNPHKSNGYLKGGQSTEAAAVASRGPLTCMLSCLPALCTLSTTSTLASMQSLHALSWRHLHPVSLLAEAFKPLIIIIFYFWLSLDAEWATAATSQEGAHKGSTRDHSMYGLCLPLVAHSGNTCDFFSGFLKICLIFSDWGCMNQWILIPQIRGSYCIFIPPGPYKLWLCIIAKL